MKNAVVLKTPLYQDIGLGKKEKKPYVQNVTQRLGNGIKRFQNNIKRLKMKEYQLKFKFGLKFNKLEQVVHKISNQNTINAVYKYDKDRIEINLCSIQFRNISELGIIQNTTNIITHELLHHLIYEETGKRANNKEEAIVEGMANQSGWGEFKCQD